MTVVKDEASGPDWTLYNADTVELLPGLPDKSIDLSVFSPPFASLYTYSASDRDMGNCRDDAEFLQHYSFIARELLRVTKPGRLCAVHCKDLVDYAGSAGRAGLRDFPGGIIRVHEEAGWKFHARTTVWKSPVTEMQRTKAHGLLYKQLRADSTFSRMGLPDYVLFFRRWAEDGEEVAPVTHTADAFPLDQWQEWASPVWMTIDQTDVLNVEQARADKDEKHMCPLQLDLIERVVRMYSNAGDVVFSPFAGIGSEGYVALRCHRKFIGVELKPEYWRWGIKNLAASRAQGRFSFHAHATAAGPAPIPPPAAAVEASVESGGSGEETGDTDARGMAPAAAALDSDLAAAAGNGGTPAHSRATGTRPEGDTAEQRAVEAMGQPVAAAEPLRATSAEQPTNERTAHGHEHSNTRREPGPGGAGAHSPVLPMGASAGELGASIGAVRGDGTEDRRGPAAQPGADGGSAQAAGVEGRGGTGGAGEVAALKGRAAEHPARTPTAARKRLTIILADGSVYG